MDDTETRQTTPDDDRAEEARVDAEIAAALVRHGIVVIGPRPGFAARRRDRMLCPRQTREG